MELRASSGIIHHRILDDADDLTMCAFGITADRDGDGHIEAKEIQKVMKNVGVSMTDSEAKKLIDAVDEDGNGMVS